MKRRLAVLLALLLTLGGTLAADQAVISRYVSTVFPQAISFLSTVAVTGTSTFTGLITANGGVTSTVYNTATNCSSAAAPAVCAAASSGSVVIAAAGTTVTVNTTAVTANSQILIQEDSSLGTKLSVTCNTTTGRDLTVTARTAGTSFVITTSAAPVTNPACISYRIVN